jgi:hypothetical protein
MLLISAKRLAATSAASAYNSSLSRAKVSAQREKM